MARRNQAAYNKVYRQKVVDEVYRAYGDKCACCGETRRAFLTIDHVNNDGAEHRRQVRSADIYTWLRKRGFPQENFVMLCLNCNMGKHRNKGICPHAEERIAAEELTIECMRDGGL